MRDLPKSTRRWRYAGWLFPLMLLAVPNCLPFGTYIPIQFDPGDPPLSGGIMCDIPKSVELGANGECADETDIASGIAITHAAVALAEGVSSSILLDFSDSATTACGGAPKAKQMQGPFPDGLALCLNCGQQIPAEYAHAAEVCIAKCVDLVEQGGIPPSEGAQAFCESHARVSTNLDPSTCLNGVCTDGGTLEPDFVDPRREQEQVTWVDLGGDASALDNNLSKLTGASSAFDSGARSQEIITQGDAWVEFAANETGVSHVVGVSHDDGGLDDPSLADVEFAISLNYDGSVYILEDGAQVINGPFGTYAPGERFRLRITDNNNGTASISYFRLVGVCNPGTVCSETPLATQTLPNPAYPLRVEATFREPGATASNVTMVRIKDIP
jgi:hypothetical protein